MENKTRNSNIELLRIVLMTCILCWHVLVHGYGFANIGNEGFHYRLNVPLTLVLSCLLVPATYTFVFISGYFGLHFHWRKFVELILGCIVVSVCGSIFLYSQGRNDIIDLWRSFFPIYPQGCWWFMTVYIWLYMLSPLIDEGISLLDQRKLRNLVLLFSLFLSVGILAMQKSVGSDLGGGINNIPYWALYAAVPFFVTKTSYESLLRFSSIDADHYLWFMVRIK